MGDVLLRLPRVAKMLDVHVNTLRSWDRQGKLKAVRTPGGQRRYRKSDIDRIIEGK